eukprot:g20014.t1
MRCLGLGVFVLALSVLLGSVPRCLWVNDLFDQALDFLQGGEVFNANNTYLTGNFAPVGEEHAATALEVLEGSVPAGLSGVFMRIGPNPIPQHRQTKRYHWFDGHGHLHTVRLKLEGKPLYSNRYLQTDKYTREVKEGRNFFPRFGELIGGGVLGLIKVFTTFQTKLPLAGVKKLHHEANTALLTFGQRLFALHEASLPFELQLTETGEVRSLGFRDFGALDFAFTAHPRVCPKNGDLLFMGYQSAPAKFKWGIFAPPSGPAATPALKHYKELDSPETEHGMAFAHDMLITEHYLIIPDLSVRFDNAGIFTGEFFRFNNQSNARWAVVNRQTGTVSWVWLERPMVSIHNLNAWEDGNNIRIWAPIGFGFEGGLDKEKAKQNPYHMGEVLLDLDKGAASMQRFLRKAGKDYNVEFCRVHPGFQGQFAQFGFCGILADDGEAKFKGMVKFDINAQGKPVSDGAVLAVILYGGRRHGGEPVFAPRELNGPRLAHAGEDCWNNCGKSGPCAWCGADGMCCRKGFNGGEGGCLPEQGDENRHACVAAAPGDGSDDGWMVDFITDEATKKSELVVYDARTFSDKPVLRLAVPYRVPFGFHGHWVTESELQAHLKAALQNL